MNLREAYRNFISLEKIPIIAVYLKISELHHFKIKYQRWK